MVLHGAPKKARRSKRIFSIIDLVLSMVLLVPLMAQMPSSRYNAKSEIFIMVDNLYKIKMPINSATSAPSKAPMVTSKVGLSFLTHGCPLMNRKECLAIKIMFSSSLVILVNFFAQVNAFFRTLSEKLG